MVHPPADPNDTIPTCRLLPPSCTVSGPPESPLQAERPPSPVMQMFWSWIRLAFPPQRAKQSALVLIGLLVNLTTAEVAWLASEVRPNPETVPVKPEKVRESERVGMRAGCTRSLKVIGLSKRTVAMSLRMLVEVYPAWILIPP